MDPEFFNQNMFDDAEEVEEYPLFISDIKPLKCQNNGCGNRLKVPIRQCKSSHLFCSDCHQGNFSCMLGDGNVLFSSPSVDAILNSIMDVCPYDGCNEQFPFHELEYHVDECCKHAHLTCPMPHCDNRSGSTYDLEMHLNTNHTTHVDSFTFGVPAQFEFQMHNDTRILIESDTLKIFIVDYEVGRDATLFKLFCINFRDGTHYTYRITDRMGVTDLLAETPVPITTFKEGLGAVGLGGSLSHQLRTGEFNYLYCNFMIKIET